MDPILMGIVACLAWLAYTYLVPAKDAKKPVPVPLPIPDGVPIARVEGINVFPEVASPRWKKFDTLLELQENLLASGTPEAEVQTICANIASKLLGVKK